MPKVVSFDFVDKSIALLEYHIKEEVKRSLISANNMQPVELKNNFVRAPKEKTEHHQVFFY